jgi:hypothetical protein
MTLELQPSGMPPRTFRCLECERRGPDEVTRYCRHHERASATQIERAIRAPRGWFHPPVVDAPSAGRKGTDARSRCLARRGRYHRAHFFLKGVTVDTDEQGDPITAPVVIEAMAGVAPKKKAVLPNGAKVAINALQEAIGDLGVIPPASNHIPPATKAVTTDQWRTYAYKRGISTSDQPRAQQMAFERAVKQLQAARAIGIWEPHVWIA